VEHRQHHQFGRPAGSTGSATLGINDFGEVVGLSTTSGKGWGKASSPGGVFYRANSTGVSSVKMYIQTTSAAIEHSEPSNFENSS